MTDNEHLIPDLSDFDPDEHFMKQALTLAEEAYTCQEVPIGAVVVHQGKIIGKGYNQRQTLKDPTAHAEILAITAAAAYLDDWRLTNCTLYVTLEPCLMCAGAIILARIPRVVYGAADPKAGAVESLYQTLSDSRLNHQTEIRKGVLAEQASLLLTDFFRHQRSLGKK